MGRSWKKGRGGPSNVETSSLSGLIINRHVLNPWAKHSRKKNSVIEPSPNIPAGPCPKSGIIDPKAPTTPKNADSRIMNISEKNAIGAGKYLVPNDGRRSISTGITTIEETL